jgi:hypothetical protein
MGFFGLGGFKSKDDVPKSVQRSMDSVAVAKKRMNKSRSQRDAEEAEWAADEEELAKIESHEKEAQAQGPSHIATYNPDSSPAKPAVKSAMKKKSKFLQGKEVPSAGALPKLSDHCNPGSDSGPFKDAYITSLSRFEYKTWKMILNKSLDRMIEAE